MTKRLDVWDLGAKGGLAKVSMFAVLAKEAVARDPVRYSLTEPDAAAAKAYQDKINPPAAAVPPVAPPPEPPPAPEPQAEAPLPEPETTASRKKK